MRDHRERRSVQSVFAGVVLSLIFSGCGGPAAQGPGNDVSPGRCAEIQKELKVYQNQGVASWAEAKDAGRSLSKKREAGLKRYNDLLNQYLGGKCHL